MSKVAVNLSSELAERLQELTEAEQLSLDEFAESILGNYVAETSAYSEPNEEIFDCCICFYFGS